MVCYLNLYAPNSSDPRLPYIYREVGPLSKRHGIPIPLNGSFTVSVTFYFPFSFSLAGKCRVVPVFNLFLRFSVFIITLIINFSKLCLDIFDDANIFLPLIS